MPIEIYGLRVGNSKELRFLSEGSPSISWKISSDENNLKMSNYQIEIAHDALFYHMYFSSGVRVGTSSRNIEWPAGALLSRQRVFIRVKVCAEGIWSPWSIPLECETSLLLRADWLGAFIASPNDLGSETPSPLPLLEKTFYVEEESSRARFYATARGLYEVKINGQALTKDLFNPGWSDYRFELPTHAFDITDLLIPGDNTVSVLLGDGWFRGMTGWEAKRNTYGERVSFLCQLEYQDSEGEKTLISDSSWRTKTGRYRFADIYEGVKVDFSLEKGQFPDSPNPISNWESCVEEEFPEVALVPSSIPPIKVIEELLPISVRKKSEDTYIFDFGRNISGWISFEVIGNRGDSITVRHAEVLNSDGDLYTRNLRRAKATDNYILGGSQKFFLEPIFTYHGFQFVEIIGALEPLNVRAKVVHSAIEATLTLETSNTLLNSLVRNIRSSQTANFFSVPTDCPQRDERLGWTGDIQSFSKTAVILYDCEKFLSNWCRQLTHSQLPSGAVTNVVPNVLESYFDSPEDAAGLSGWGDAATLVPWNLYIAYADKETLLRQIPSMERWVAYLESRCDQSGLLHDTANQIGDWLDPNAIEGEPFAAKVDTAFVMNAFFSYSTRILSKSLAIQGNALLSQKYLERAEEIASRSWLVWRDEISQSMTGCALALEFLIASVEEREELAQKLATLVAKSEGRAEFGLIGTAIVLPALSRNGQIDAAYSLLFNEKCPGWMHQVIQGASTMWERWDSKHVDGAIDEEPHFWKGVDVGMNSFNHYHLGSIGDWIIENIGGIGVIQEQPGYKEISFAPKPSEQVLWSQASLETPLGLTQNHWRVDGEEFSMEIIIPIGSRGRVQLPPGFSEEIEVNEIKTTENEFSLESGKYRVRAQARRRMN